MSEPQEPTRFSYADYEQAIRARHYGDLRKISEATAAVFENCRSVLDIACGQGILLEILKTRGISAQGVDNEPTLVADCRTRGLTITEDDVLHFLQTTEARFDGAYCGHLLEHLPYEAVLDLLEGTRRVLSPGGLLFLRWPNPRSAVTQHYSFWQDPTHVRFYDGDFLRAVLEHYEFEIMQTHYNTTKPLNFAVSAPDESTLHDDVQPKSPGGRRAKARRLLGDAVRALKRGPGPARAVAAAMETLVTRHQVTTMNRLIFQLPFEATILARRGS